MMVEMYVTDSLFLDAEKISEKVFIVHLSNGKEIRVEKDAEYVNETGKKSTWMWKIDEQFFDKDEYALNYLKKLLVERLTGKRIILHSKRNAPDICGVDGRACRARGKCNTALCSYCPVAEKFFADRDGVELVYAI